MSSGPIRGVKHRSAQDVAEICAAATARAADNTELFARVQRFLMFVGYARSGSSLVGALLDAHPQLVCANELDAVGFVDHGIGRAALFQLLLENSQGFADEGGEWTGYSYAVPDQWQGRWRELHVIGDKKSGVATSRIAEQPDLLDQLCALVDVPVRIVHVVRHPLDNIATKVARNPTHDMSRHVDKYFHLCRAVQDIKDRQRSPDGGPEVLDVQSERLIAEPRTELVRLLRFLDLDEDEAYLAAATSIVYASPSRSRDKIEWPAATLRDIAERAAAFPFLADYAFDL